MKKRNAWVYRVSNYYLSKSPSFPTSSSFPFFFPRAHSRALQNLKLIHVAFQLRIIFTSKVAYIFLSARVKELVNKIDNILLENNIFQNKRIRETFCINIETVFTINYYRRYIQ